MFEWNLRSLSCSPSSPLVLTLPSRMVTQSDNSLSLPSAPYFYDSLSLPISLSHSLSVSLSLSLSFSVSLSLYLSLSFSLRSLLSPFLSISPFPALPLALPLPFTPTHATHFPLYQLTLWFIHQASVALGLRHSFYNPCKHIYSFFSLLFCH